MWFNNGQSLGKNEQAMSKDMVCQSSLSDVFFSIEKLSNLLISSFSCIMNLISVDAQK
jgi:hypothetical protein